VVDVGFPGATSKSRLSGQQTGEVAHRRRAGQRGYEATRSTSRHATTVRIVPYPRLVTQSGTNPGSDEEDALAEGLAEAEPEEDEHGSLGRGDVFKKKIGGTRDSLESRRSTSRLIDIGFHAYEGNRRIPASLLAGALAARIVIYIIPFMVLAVVATGLYSDAYNTDPVETARDAGMPGLLAEAVEDSTQASRGFKTLTLLGMSLVTIWTADSLAKLVRWIHALVWATPMERPRRRWMLPVAVIGLSIASLISSRTGLAAQTWTAAIRVSELVLEMVVLSGIWLLVSRHLPHVPAARGWRPFLPGAVLIGAATIGMKAAMVLYFAPRAVALAERYDEVATAMVVLTWGYWVAFVIVFSAVLNSAMFRSQPSRTGST
jgi:uncharacterized BrkB/YihY/UPF0761 family membrane protein